MTFLQPLLTSLSQLLSRTEPTSAQKLAISCSSELLLGKECAEKEEDQALRSLRSSFL